MFHNLNLSTSWHRYFIVVFKLVLKSLFYHIYNGWLVQWLKDIITGATGREFNSRADQMGHSVASGSPSPRCFCVAQALRLGDDSASRCTFLRTFVRIVKFSLFTTLLIAF